ncbi:MAG: hypothetical protein ACJ754_00415 [Pyrinomonadaceae bacterium]
MSSSNGESPIDLLTEVALRLFLVGEPAAVRDRARPKMLQTVGVSYSLADDGQKKIVLNAVEDLETKKIPRAPPPLVNWLSFELGTRGLAVWAEALHPKVTGWLGADALLRLISDWTVKQKPAVQSALLKAGVRYGVGVVKTAGEALITKTLGQLLSDKEVAMVDFLVDPRGLPANFIGPKAYADAVNGALQSRFSVADAPTQRSVTGLLLLGEHFDPNASDFNNAVTQAWLELLQTTKEYNTNADVLNKDLFAFVSDAIPKLRDSNGGSPVVFFQEIGSVGRFVVRGANEVPFHHPNFITQVRLGLNSYVAGTPTSDSLDLPPLTGEGGTDVEIEPDNIRAVALVYAGHQLEEMRLFGVVDRITELFYNGLLPIGFDAGGRAIDSYYWDREDRMKES